MTPLDEIDAILAEADALVARARAKLSYVRDQIMLVLVENRHLADGDDCTLRRLKDVAGPGLLDPEPAGPALLAREPGVHDTVLPDCGQPVRPEVRADPGDETVQVGVLEHGPRAGDGERPSGGGPEPWFTEP